jgi:tRNA pseudouridine38-40 synthase
VPRLKLVVEYDGTGYCGFQRQPGRPTIQDELERAIARVTGEAAAVVPAGRTDAGVHAAGQVVHFDSGTTLPPDELWRALNAVLPAAIAVRDLAAVDDGFHARYGARVRRYRYTILNRAVRSPLEARYAAHVTRPLDVTAMQAAAEVLVGDHDFASFGGKMWAGGTTRRTIHSLVVTRQGDRVLIEVSANAYLSRMVRSIAGCLVAVGLGELSADDVRGILDARDRAMVKRLAPPEGLCLLQVDYGETG